MIVLKEYKSGLKAGGLKKAIKVLKKGGVIVYPTETTYGLGADATNPKAISKVFKIKARHPQRPILIMVASIKDLNQLTFVSPDALKLAKKFWPGPLTLVLKKKSFLPAILTPGQTKVGVRLPKNKLANLLVKSLKRPITSTSANISGQGNIYSSKKILKLFQSRSRRPDLLIDSGRLPVVKPSTIIDLTVKPYKILRQGPIKIKAIERVLNKKVVAV